jgi:hypothetical protein
VIITWDFYIEICRNCHGPRSTDCDICALCIALPSCNVCGRYMVESCFDPNDERGRCFNCVRKATQTRTKHTSRQVVNEVVIDTGSASSFEQLFNERGAQIQQIINDYRENLRYVFAI